MTRPATFNCPEWPGCGCPDGTVATDCPGSTVSAHDPLAAAIVEARNAEREGRAFRAVTALEALQDADSHKAAIRSFIPQDAPPSSRRANSAERLIADMAALDKRCERGLQELSAIQCELAMIRRDLATLHGVPATPDDT